jgi:hypothetical protein
MSACHGCDGRVPFFAAFRCLFFFSHRTGQHSFSGRHKIFSQPLPSSIRIGCNGPFHNLFWHWTNLYLYYFRFSHKKTHPLQKNTSTVHEWIHSGTCGNPNPPAIFTHLFWSSREGTSMVSSRECPKFCLKVFLSEECMKNFRYLCLKFFLKFQRD